MTTVARVVAALGLVLVSWLLWGARSRKESMRAPIVRTAVKHPWLVTAVLAAGALVIAALVIVSGMAPIKASSGHWAMTHAMLDFAKVRAVSTSSWGVRAPALDDEALMLRGASHYDTGCLMCHGGPDRPVPPVVSRMTPAPPPLDPQHVGRWRPEELFVIVKHGIKFTGMPGWPAQQRDDEVWAMVAFLRRLPSLDGAAYRRLARGDAGTPESVGDTNPAPPPVRDVCARCHGAAGTGRGAGAFPSLAGQRAPYLYEALRAYREGRRHSGTMGEVASRLTDDAMREIAGYYRRLPARAADTVLDEAAVTRGRALATAGAAERDLPACVECHGPTTLPKNPAYPRLANQHAGYLRLQLRLLQERRRGGSENVELMHAFVNRLTRAEIDDVAAYYAALSSVDDPLLAR
jgi:cytochrome c553